MNVTITWMNGILKIRGLSTGLRHKNLLIIWSSISYVTPDFLQSGVVSEVGVFDNEPETVAVMDKYLEENGYANDFTDERHHHEIYLSDPIKTAPENVKLLSDIR